LDPRLVRRASMMVTGKAEDEEDDDTTDKPLIAAI
jgi:hypothetical protein